MAGWWWIAIWARPSGPLSPLLANVLLDEVDKALEARGYSLAR